MDKNGIRRGIYLVAGAYLVYLGVNLFKSSIIRQELAGAGKAAGAIFSIVFIAFGAAFFILAIRSMIVGNQEQAGPEEADAVADEAAPGEDSETFALDEKREDAVADEGSEDAPSDEVSADTEALDDRRPDA